MGEFLMSVAMGICVAAFLTWAVFFVVLILYLTKTKSPKKTMFGFLAASIAFTALSCVLCISGGAVKSSSPEFKEEQARKEQEKEEAEKQLYEAQFRFSKPGDDLRPIEQMFINNERIEDIRSMTLNDDGVLAIKYETEGAGLFMSAWDTVHATSYLYYFEPIYGQNDFPQVKMLVVSTYAPTQDRYGNESVSLVLTMGLSAEVGKKINYDNVSTEKFLYIVQTEGTYIKYIK
jgi:hypothetical protein